MQCIIEYYGVEIHGAHGYLLNEVYSPLTNFREDQYGADTIENRLRIHTEIIQKIRKAVGNDYPIAVRLGACDYIEGGSTIKDGADAAKILEECGADIIDVSGGLCGFVVKGRTQSGYFGDSRPHQAVIASRSAHIYMHETGAIEASGHKVIDVCSKDGKITLEQIKDIMEEHQGEHMVSPKLVFITNATELGTIYTKAELERLYKCCKEYQLILYCD